MGRPHGLDGSFHVTRPEADLLASPVVVAGAAREIARRAGTDAKPILRLEGVSTREQAEALRGEELLVPRGELAEDEYWADDLVGCEVPGLGVVERVLSYPSCDLLVVGETLVPLIDDAVRSVDLEARVIEVDLEFLGAR